MVLGTKTTFMFIPCQLSLMSLFRNSSTSGETFLEFISQGRWSQGDTEKSILWLGHPTSYHSGSAGGQTPTIKSFFWNHLLITVYTTTHNRGHTGQWLTSHDSTWNMQLQMHVLNICNCVTMLFFSLYFTFTRVKIMCLHNSQTHSLVTTHSTCNKQMEFDWPKISKILQFPWYSNINNDFNSALYVGASICVTDDHLSFGKKKEMTFSGDFVSLIEYYVPSHRTAIYDSGYNKIRCGFGIWRLWGKEAFEMFSNNGWV